MRRSIGAKILLLAALNILLLVAVGLVASGVRVPRSAREMVMQAADPRLQDAARRIALDLERSSPDEATRVLQRYGSEYHTRFLLVRNDGSTVAGDPMPLPAEVIRALSGPPPRGPRPGGEAGRPQGPGGPPDRVGPPDPATGLRMPQTPAQLVTVDGGAPHWIILRTPIRFAGSTDIAPGSLIIIPFGWFGDRLLMPVQWLGWAFAALAITLLCWAPLLRGLTKSLVRMEHATSEIAHGRFSARVALTRADELGRLSAAIDTMATRLDAMVTGQKRFLGDTAHELRSPLGRMQVALEILDGKVGETERLYVADLKEDIEELRRLTDDLLHYAHAELSQRESTLTTISLHPIIERVIAKEGADSTIVVRVPDDISVRGTAALVERAIANVLRNAVKYAGTAGPITVSAVEDAGAVNLTIADAGPGVKAASLSRLFDPFFREDEARNRKTGGVGLGLAIVRSAVEACGGTVSCANRLPHGLEVQMVLHSGTKEAS